MTGKKVVYVSDFNPCCFVENGQQGYKSQEQLLKEKALVAKIYLVDESELHKVSGDDWDDAPSCCNSEPPSERDLKTLEVIEVRLGEKLKHD